MVALFVDKCAYAECGEGVEECECVELERRQIPVQYCDSEILDVHVDGI